eukprot:CAMPEP_0168496434 /NCGR_PEP_ID=MMETSP0228-20121227/72259_1 /TAXON_ID=133427 /ORGANISM="Protoceratium reticulatum, Strain CCCM 535 (=CCMP 1889)" /LENGTH=52 /DNA_ID=CAMNT_0008513301 /DNA_START=140 /DNA_END=295 /DNA_ORIENTATION=-
MEHADAFVVELDARKRLFVGARVVTDLAPSWHQHTVVDQPHQRRNAPQRECR